jgi:hypothetical protein
MEKFLSVWSAQRATITTATACCGSAAGCCSPPMVNTKRLEHVKTSNLGQPHDFIYSTQRTAVSAKNIVLQNIIYYCTVNLHCPTLCLWSKDGNNVVYSWPPSVMNGPNAKFKKIFLFKQLSMTFTRQIWVSNREHSKVFEAIFVLYFYATHSCIFVSNAKLVHRRQPYLTLMNATTFEKKIEHTFVIWFSQ